MAELRVVKCVRCGKIFSRDRRPICSDCWREEQDNLDKVRRFLDENPGTGIPMTSSETGIPEKDIIRWIKEGHLMLARGGEGISYPCESCGKPIGAGRFCSTCGEKLTRGLEGAKHTIRRRAEAEDEQGWKKTGVKKSDDGGGDPVP